MTRAEFAAELGGILRLLREHAFLAYSPSGRREYERKLGACAELFAYLVFSKTGVPVKALPGFLPLESVRDATYENGKTLAARAAKRALVQARKASGLDREYYAECATLWERAAARLAERD